MSPSGENIGSLDRQAFAMTASYDLLRANGQKFGRILVNSWIGLENSIVRWWVECGMKHELNK